MVKFENKRVGEGKLSVGQQLKEAREAQRLSLSEAARQLKIQPQYLAALEAGRFGKLPAGVYIFSYLKQYALWLGLPSERLAVELKQEMERRQTGQEHVFERRVIERHYFLVIPRLIRYSLIVIISLACFAYLGWLLTNIYRPPKLEVISPPDKLVLNQARVDLIGQTEAESTVTVNGQSVVVDAKGNFNLWVDLKEGLNNITVVAAKQNKKNNVIVRQILYQK